MKVLLILATILGIVLLASATGHHRGKCSFVTRPVNGYGYGSSRSDRSIRFTCQSGYYLYGIKSFQCSDAYGRLKWSHDLRPVCIPIGKSATVDKMFFLYNLCTVCVLLYMYMGICMCVFALCVHTCVRACV